MEDDRDTYVTQLKEVFVSCDTTGSGCLNESELKHLCMKLHLTSQVDILIYDLQKNGTTEVKFEDFKNSFVALLSQSVPSDKDEHYEEVSAADREVSPKFTLGNKKYGRRSRPVSIIEDSLQPTEQNEHSSEDETSGMSSPCSETNQKYDSGSGKRPRSPSYPHHPPTKSGRMAGGQSDPENSFYHHQCLSSDNEGNSYFENNPVEFLQDTWKNLDIGSDGFLTKEELALVCEHIGMDMTEEVISQLFEKLDCDQDGRISFEELIQGLFQHGEKSDNCDSEAVKVEAAQTMFKEQSRDEQLLNSPISGLFSCLDSANTGYADGSRIVELWDSLEVPFPPQMLEELGFSSRQKVSLCELSAALEEEMMSCMTTQIGQLALITFRNELNYLRQWNEQIRTERNKLRENVDDANTRAALLAQEIDDNHAKLETTLQQKLVCAEKKYHEQVRQLMDDLQQEREALSLQATKFKQQLQSEIQSIRDEETQLKNRLFELEQENRRLESELQEASEGRQEADKQKDALQKELPVLKKRLADLESHQDEVQEHHHQALLVDIENYKRFNQELQDKIDELTLEIENLQHSGSGLDAGSTSSVSRTHSWLSDYKKATLVGFKRRGSESSSEDNSDEECPTTGKMRRTFVENEEQSSLEPEMMEETCSTSQPRNCSPATEDCKPSSVDIMLCDMFIDHQKLKAQLHKTEELKQIAEIANRHSRLKCKLITKIAYESTKAALS